MTNVRRLVDYMSHSTVGVHQKFLSPSHQELDISPDTVLERKLFAPPDRHFYALVLNRIYECLFHHNFWFLTWGTQSVRNV